MTASEARAFVGPFFRELVTLGISTPLHVSDLPEDPALVNPNSPNGGEVA